MTMRTRSANIGGVLLNANGITLSTGTDLSGQSNSAYAQANAAYNAANNAQVTVYQNSTSSITTQKINFVNTATITVAVSADGSNANIALTAVGGAAYDQANAAYAQANTARTTANDAYGQANAAYGQANAAYGAANNGVLKAGDTMTGQLNISSGGLLVTGNVGIGNTSPSDPFVIQDKSLTPNATIHLISSNGSIYSTNFWSTNYGSDGGYLYRRASGTLASPTATSSGRITFIIGASTDDGTTFRNTSAINLGLTATANATSHPSYIAFDTTAVGATGRAERVRIDPSGNVGIGTTSPAAKLDIAASIPEMRLSSSGGATGQLLADGSSFYVGPTGAHSLRLQTNGTTRALIDSSGNVGIGTASPATKLQVYGDTNADVNLRITNANSGSSASALLSFGTNADSNMAYLGVPSTTGTNANQLLIFNRVAHGIVLGTNNTERARITPSGNVCIGTTGVVWNERFQVNSGSGTGTVGIGVYTASNTYTGSLIRVQSENNTGSAYYLYEGRGAGGAVNYWVNGAGGAYFAGNVGIGTTTPTNSSGYSTISVNGSTGGQVVFQTGGTYKQTIYSTSTDLNILNGQAGNLTFGTNNTERMRIDSSGNVGIGTTNPITKLQVNGNIYANGTPVQVQYTSSGTRVSVDSSSFTEPSTNYRVAITPKSTASMIKLTYFIPMTVNSQQNTLYTIRAFRILSGTTSYALTSAGASNGSRNVFAGVTFRPNNGYDSNDTAHQTFTVIDFPNTTSTCTYGFDFKRETGGSGTAYFGYSLYNGDLFGFDADIVIIAEEIGQ